MHQHVPARITSFLMHLLNLLEIYFMSPCIFKSIEPAHSRPAHVRVCSAFTLIELLVVISIITALIAILLPALARSRDSARSIQCASQLRQVGLTLNSYASDNKDNFPRQKWTEYVPA